MIDDYVMEESIRYYIAGTENCSLCSAVRELILKL